MKQLKNKILIKVNRKLIFIFSILMIVALNLFGEVEEAIKFEYYYYTNKLYHSTLKTDIIPSEYVFIKTYSNKDGRNKNLYLYNLKTKEKKLFYTYKYHKYKNDSRYYVEDIEYYDINGNLTTNWTNENMEENCFYEITNNRFGEIFYHYHPYNKYNDSSNDGYEIVIITKDDKYIQKAYKYSLTQPEIINKKDRGIYLFKRQYDSSYSELLYTLCFQNEYYKNNYFYESGLLNYNSNGRVIVHEYDRMTIDYSYSIYDGWRKEWITFYGNSGGYGLTNIAVYFQLNNKSLIKPTWNEFTNDFLNYRKSIQKGGKVFYTKEDIENNLREYSVITDTKYLGFIPIEEFEYCLLAD